MPGRKPGVFALNSDTEILVEQILAEAGAVTDCPVCHGSKLRTGDDEAEARAYAIATNAWKDRERGFRNMEREEVVSIIKQALLRARSTCPECREY
jgi:hypothetical protein